MSKKRKRKKPSDSEENFGLSEPTESIDDFRREESSKKPKKKTKPSDSRIHSSLEDAEAKFKQMGWKGIEEPDEEEIDDPFAVKKEPIPEDELDMTPMVDVTFLLLIFFMVTASFSLQKSLEQPHAKSEQPSENYQEEDEPEPDYVEVVIDQTNTFYVTSRDAEEVEAPSEREMRARVKDAVESSSVTRMIIRAHVDCMHRNVVTAWDAGVVNNLAPIEIQTTEEDF